MQRMTLRFDTLGLDATVQQNPIFLEFQATKANSDGAIQEQEYEGPL